MNEETESTSEDVLYTLPDSLADVVSESQDEAYTDGYGNLIYVAQENLEVQAEKVETGSKNTIPLLSVSANNTESFSSDVYLELDSSSYNIWQVQVNNDLFTDEVFYLWLADGIDTIHDIDGYLYNTGSDVVMGLLTDSLTVDVNSTDVYMVCFPSLTSSEATEASAELGQVNYMVHTYVDSSDEVVSDLYGSVIEVVEAPAVGVTLTGFQVAVIALLLVSVLFGFVGGLLKR